MYLNYIICLYFSPVCPWFCQFAFTKKDVCFNSMSELETKKQLGLQRHERWKVQNFKGHPKNSPKNVIHKPEFAIHVPHKKPSQKHPPWMIIKFLSKPPQEVIVFFQTSRLKGTFMIHKPLVKWWVPGLVNDHIASWLEYPPFFNRKYIDSIRGRHFPASYVRLRECKFSNVR